MYTELDLKIRLRSDVPENVKYALVGEAVFPHAFFALPRRSWIRAEHVKGCLYSVTANLKNYDSEIEMFLDWISPYLDHYVGEVIGTWHYEEWINPVPISYGLCLQSGTIEW
jgi:hypothetical protein